jgi:branched-chain amino acid aminotransferase
MLSEGSSENLFLVKDDVLHTTPISSSVLQGITRDSILTLADHLSIPVREQAMPREMLYVADEVFFTGTAAEITPVRSVDRTPVGAGKPGPITRALQDAFFGLFDGKTPDRWGWLDRVPVVAPRRHVPEPSNVPLAAAS